MCLVELSKRDSEWRKIATKICGNKDTADDIVQEMYLKLSNYDNPHFNTSYVSYCMYHLYLKKIKQDKKQVNFDLIEYKEYQEIHEGLDDNQYKAISIFKSLPWHQQEIMKAHVDLSIRQIETKYNINRGFVYDSVKEVKKRVING